MYLSVSSSRHTGLTSLMIFRGKKLSQFNQFSFTTKTTFLERFLNIHNVHKTFHERFFRHTKDIHNIQKTFQGRFTWEIQTAKEIFEKCSIFFFHTLEWCWNGKIFHKEKVKRELKNLGWRGNVSNENIFSTNKKIKKWFKIQTQWSIQKYFNI